MFTNFQFLTFPGSSPFEHPAALILTHLTKVRSRPNGVNFENFERPIYYFATQF